MNFYKEVAKIQLFHNGKQYDKGAVVRERVPLSESTLREIERTPELTNCEYILIEEPKEAKKTATKVTGEKKWAQMNAEERAVFQAKKEEEKKQIE